MTYSTDHVNMVFPAPIKDSHAFRSRKQKTKKSRQTRKRDWLSIVFFLFKIKSENISAKSEGGMCEYSKILTGTCVKPS